MEMQLILLKETEIIDSRSVKPSIMPDLLSDIPNRRITATSISSSNTSNVIMSYASLINKLKRRGNVFISYCKQRKLKILAITSIAGIAVYLLCTKNGQQHPQVNSVQSLLMRYADHYSLFII